MAYRCKLCGEIVEDESEMELHIISAHPDIIFENFEELEEVDSDANSF